MRRVAPANLVALELAHDHVGRRGEVGGRAGQVAQLRQDVAEGLEAEVLLVVDRVPVVDMPRELACVRVWLQSGRLTWGLRKVRGYTHGAAASATAVG